MKKTLAILLGISVFCFGLATMLSAQAPETKIPIRAKGSDDMAGRVDALSKIFVKDNPNVNIIVSGGSSGTALTDLVDKNCEVLMLGCDLTPEEKRAAQNKGIQLTEKLVGYGAVVIVTYPENPIDELTVDQVQKLLKGDYLSWNQVGGPDDPVTIISIESLNSDTRLYLLRNFLGTPQLKSKTELVSSFSRIPNKVAETKGALGFARLRDLEGKGEQAGAKVLKIKKDADSPGVLPSRATIADGSYPIKRPFVLCFDANSSGDVKRFVEFIASKGWGAQIR